jgi:murein DD-endopeptidase MepM/ murein hydrolase activator NlpD
MQPISSALQPAILRQDVATHTAALQRPLEPQGLTLVGNQQSMQEQLEEFASLLIFQMLQTMRRTIPRTGLLDKGFAQDLYMSLFDQEVARDMARRRDLGLTSLLEQQFTGATETVTGSGQRSRALETYRQQQGTRFDKLLLPVAGHLSSHFGWRQDPFSGEEKWHEGIDIAAPSGTLVRAAAAGEVVFSGPRQDYGNLLIVEHQDGYQTYYAHHTEPLVSTGTAVQRGQPVAKVGQTGRATGPHVHFEVRRHGQALDPQPFFAETLTTKRGN